MVEEIRRLEQERSREDRRDQKAGNRTEQRGQKGLKG